MTGVGLLKGVYGPPARVARNYLGVRAAISMNAVRAAHRFLSNRVDGE